MDRYKINNLIPQFIVSINLLLLKSNNFAIPHKLTSTSVNPILASIQTVQTMYMQELRDNVKSFYRTSARQQLWSCTRDKFVWRKLIIYSILKFRLKRLTVWPYYLLQATLKIRPISDTGNVTDRLCYFYSQQFPSWS